jgi:hypothetical protein
MTYRLVDNIIYKLKKKIIIWVTRLELVKLKLFHPKWNLVTKFQHTHIYNI